MNDLTKVFTERRVRILGLITKYEGLYIREIAEKTNTNPAAVHTTMKLFKKMGFVSEKTVKNRNIITANRDNTILKKIKSLVNVYELQTNKAFKKLEEHGKVGIYGSFAKGEDTAESDIDLWLYSNKKISAVKLRDITRELEKDFGREIRLLVLNNSRIKSLKDSDPEFYFRLKLTSVGDDVFG